MVFWRANKLRQMQAERREAAKAGLRFSHLLRGHRAYQEGETPVDCPFALDTPEQRAWIAGWFNEFDRRHE
jgi:hypothetical protein